MLAICAGIAVGFMVARGGEEHGATDRRVRTHIIEQRMGLELPDMWSELRVVQEAGAGGVGVGAPPELEAPPTRLVIGGLATADGEPEVIAATVEPTRDIVEPVGDAVERWRSLVASIFPEFAVDTVLRIIRCESGGDPNATGHAGERGLLQVHPQFHADSTYDPEGNLRAGYRISSGGTDWSAWTCRP